MPFLVLTDKVVTFCLFVNSMGKTKIVPLASSIEIRRQNCKTFKEVLTFNTKKSQRTRSFYSHSQEHLALLIHH